MAYKPSPIKRESVISQAAQEICRFIEAERLSAGEALPPETRLSQMLGISRNSVREALRVLHGLGYIEKAAGRRVVVTAAARGGKSMFDESVLIEAAPKVPMTRSMGCSWQARAIRCWWRCSTRPRWRGSRTSRRSTRAFMTRGI